MVYQAAEDSLLLLSCLPEVLKEKTFLEIGCGSGIISVEAARRGAKVCAVDIDMEAVSATQESARKAGVSVEVLHSDMFYAVKGRMYDVIVCNPPYLPDEPLDPDIALDGGLHGWEWTARFLARVSQHLHENGAVYLLYSNRTNEEKVRKLIFDHGFLRRELARKGVGLNEVLIVDELRMYLARGARGVTFTEVLDGRMVLVKELREDTDADTLGNEANYMQVLNKVGIGPRFISFDGVRLVREFVDGVRVEEFLTACTKTKALSVVEQVLEQCYTMDSLKINKFEMTNPYKHILVRANGKAVMIDFERCRYTEKPKNVTQFVQYLVKPELMKLMSAAGIDYDSHRILDLAGRYKQEGYPRRIFDEIIMCLRGGRGG